MPIRNLKPTHKPGKDYYKALKAVGQLSRLHACGKKVGWVLAEQYQIPRPNRRPIRADGVLLDQYKLQHAIWEAKDSDDDLVAKVKRN